MMTSKIGRAPSLSNSFTLIEIIVVLAIISIVLGISLPFWHSLIQNTQLKGFSRQVISLLNSSRNYAITKNSPCRVNFDMEKGIIWSDIDTQTVGRKISIPRNMNIEIDGESPDRIEFFPNGTTDETKEIEILYKGRRIKIKIFSSTGRVKIIK